MSNGKNVGGTIEIILNLPLAACGTVFLSSEIFRTEEMIYGMAGALVLLALKNVYRAWKMKRQ